MPEPALQPAHQFDDLEQQRESSALGMWVFLVTEVMFFGGMFGVYTIYRLKYPEAFAAASNHLDPVLGTVNTAVLIGSSLTVALAVQAASRGSARGVQRYLLLTMGLAVVFLAIKAFEYWEKAQEGLLPGPGFRYEGDAAPGMELFFAVYFVMTGFHALHMVIGLGIFVVLIALARRGWFSPGYYNPVETAGLYWHFVDIVWIFLFPLLYLMGRHTL